MDEPADFVIGTGEAHSVREFLDEAFGYLDMDWHEYVKIDPRYYRPNEVDFLQADPSQGAEGAGLGAARVLQGPGADHGGCRPGTAPGLNHRARGRRSSRSITATGTAGTARW